MEIIQQWQFLGDVPPELMKDELFSKCKELGITSIQSYLTWSEAERENGKWDFSAYDPLVEKIKENGLKWVPFLIMGPDYATPRWFHKSRESLYAKCLEHKKESRVQSIWNVNLLEHRDRFLKEFSERYGNSGILESVIFGISGNWGEAIYPVSGGFYRGSHSHLGYWCGDKKAKDSFVGYVSRKYNSLDRLNSAWETSFKNTQEIEFPSVKVRKSLKDLIFFIGVKLPSQLKGPIKRLLESKIEQAFLSSDKSGVPKDTNRVRWLDFVEWYLDEMNRWVENWLEAGKRFFPNNKIYLVTGGTGHPATGADFSKQVKIAAKYGAGVRITNQTNDYSQSFILTRLVASACKVYKTDFITEEAAVLQNAKGVTMRIFDAVSSGARGIYCKNFISTGGDPCIKKYLPVGAVTEGAKSLKDNNIFFDRGKPIVKTAVLFPRESIFLNPDLVISLYNKCAKLRDAMDFDLIDENMIKDGGLNFYENLLILEGEITDREVLETVGKWQEKGHVIDINPDKIAKDIDGAYDGIYATQLEKEIIYYNSTDRKVSKNIPFLNKTIELEPNSIKSIKI